MSLYQYIDPGTGSMLLTIIISLVTAGTFALRGAVIKLKFLFSGGSAKQGRGGTRIPVVMFSEGKTYWSSYKPLCDELEARGFDCEFWTMAEDDPIFDQGYEHIAGKYIGTGNSAFARLNAMKADIVLSTTSSLDVFQWKRSKDVSWYAYFSHSFDDGTKCRMFGFDHFDAILAPGPYSEPPLRTIEGLRGLSAKEFVPVGVPYLDALKARAEAAEAKGIEDSTGAPSAIPAVPTVLLAPSWGEGSILRRYGADALRALTGTGYRVIVRPHPQSRVADKEVLENLMARFPEGEMLTWDFDPDNFASLSSADVLISDFSAVVFDYSFVFRRPLLYAQGSYDTNPYDSAWLEEEPLTLRLLPKIGRPITQDTFPHIKEIIDSLLQGEGAMERDRIREDVWPQCGQSVTLIADYLEEKLAVLNALAKESAEDSRADQNGRRKGVSALKRNRQSRPEAATAQPSAASMGNQSGEEEAAR